MIRQDLSATKHGRCNVISACWKSLVGVSSLDSQSSSHEVQRSVLEADRNFGATPM